MLFVTTFGHQKASSLTNHFASNRIKWRSATEKSRTKIHPFNHSKTGFLRERQKRAKS